METVHARQALPTEAPHYPQSPWLKNQITGLLPRVRLLGKDGDYRKRNPARVGDGGEPLGYWSKLPKGMEVPYVYLFCFLGTTRTIYSAVNLSP